MKKFLSIILISLLLLCSCKDKQLVNQTQLDEYGYSEDVYFYFNGQRVNAQTGAVTYICTDPLCSHTKNECIPMQIDPLLYRDVLEYNNCLYFIYTYINYDEYYDYKNFEIGINPDAEKTYHLAEYDISTNKITLHMKIDQPGDRVLLYQQYLYFSNYITVENSDPVERLLTVSCIDVKNKSKSTICKELPESYSLQDADDDYLYFYDTVNLKYYRYHIKNAEMEVRAEKVNPSEQLVEGYVHLLDYEADKNGKVTSRSRCMKNLETGEITTLEDGLLFGELYAYNGYIYYTKRESEKNIKSGDYIIDTVSEKVTAITSNHGGKIYRMKYDGSEKEVVYDGGMNVQFQMNGAFMMFTGRYMAVWGTDFTLNEDGIYVTNLAEDEAYRVLIVDLVTKESKWIGIKQPDSNPVITN